MLLCAAEVQLLRQCPLVGDCYVVGNVVVNRYCCYCFCCCLLSLSLLLLLLLLIDNCYCYCCLCLLLLLSLLLFIDIVIVVVVVVVVVVVYCKICLVAVQQIAGKVNRLFSVLVVGPGLTASHPGMTFGISQLLPPHSDIEV